MNYKPILIIGGEPNSVFFEIFFKTIKKNRFKSPLIIIASKNILIKQMKALKFKFNINVIDINYKFLNQLNNQKINIINVDYAQKKIFEDISIKSNIYIDKCFKIALEIMKKIDIPKLSMDLFLKNIF